MKSIILAIDVGSSSIRCTGYEYHGIIEYRPSQLAGGEPCPINGGNNVELLDDDNVPSPIASPIEGIRHTIQMAAIVPNAGHIRIHEVLTAIEECIDEMLRLLRQRMPDSSYQMIGVGFSTFVMNLVGVDICGEPVGEVATCSYACNREDVVRECQKLRE